MTAKRKPNWNAGLTKAQKAIANQVLDARPPDGPKRGQKGQRNPRRGKSGVSLAMLAPWNIGSPTFCFLSD
jgi:hypothetical protein